MRPPPWRAACSFGLCKGGILLLLPCLSRPPTGRPQPIQFAGFISHLTNSNGCGNLSAKVADRVPVSSLLSPATRHVSATIRSPDHSVPAPNTSLPAFSSTYKSLSSTIDLQPSRYQQLTDPSFRNPFVFSSIQNPWGCGGVSAWLFTSHRSRVTSHVLSFGCRLFHLSLRSFSHSLPLFSTVCSLFCENTPLGVPMPMKVKVHPVLCYSLLLPFQGASQ